MNNNSERKARAASVLSLLRIKHWVKNVLVFLPAFFGRTFPEAVGMALPGFFALCAAASGIYAINDCHDAPLDRKHPDKCRRPVASGALSVPFAMGIGCACIAAGYLVLLVMRAPWLSVLCLTVYIAMNLAYSLLGLKKVPVLDVSIIAFGFVLRILYGGALTHVVVSNWMLLTVLMGSYYLALGKRRNELRDSPDTREVLKRYTYHFLDRHMYLFLTLTIAFYSLWGAEGTQAVGTLVTVPLVIIIAMRYNLMVEGDASGDPVQVLLGDRMLLVLGIMYLLLMFCILYQPFFRG